MLDWTVAMEQAEFIAVVCRNTMRNRDGNTHFFSREASRFCNTIYFWHIYLRMEVIQYPDDEL